MIKLARFIAVSTIGTVCTARFTFDLSRAEEKSCHTLQTSLSELAQVYGDLYNGSRGNAHRVNKLFRAFSDQCSTPNTPSGFRNFRSVFNLAVGTRGFSDDPNIVCPLVHDLTLAVVGNRHCQTDSGKSRRLDDYESTCVAVSFKAAIAKLRQAAANIGYNEMVAGMNLSLYTSLEERPRQLCIRSFQSLFNASLAFALPWEHPTRMPQVMVPPIPATAMATELRSIPIWSEAALSQKFSDPASTTLETPRDVSLFLKVHWKTFLSEVDNIPNHLWTDPYPFLNPVKNGWRVYVLYHNYSWDEERCLFTPKTCRLVKGILPASRLPYFHPYNEEAGFFSMAPGAIIAPHSGPVNTILNTHIGLRGVEGATFFVNGTRVLWHEGEAFSFEDSFEHWGNHAVDAPESRVIFMIRQMHPDVTRAHYLGHHHTQAVSLLGGSSNPTLSKLKGVRGSTKKTQRLSTTAVCLIGAPGATNTSASLDKNVLQVLDADLFGVARRDDDVTKWFDDRVPLWNQSRNGMHANYLGGLPGFPRGNGAFQLMERHRCLEVIGSSERTRSAPYERVAIGRRDLMWVGKHPDVQLSVNECWIPCQGNDAAGYCDHWMLCSRDAATAYVDGPLDSIPWGNVNQAIIGQPNAEILLRYGLLQRGVKVKRGTAPFFRSCRVPVAPTANCAWSSELNMAGKRSGGQFREVLLQLNLGTRV